MGRPGGTRLLESASSLSLDHIVLNDHPRLSAGELGTPEDALTDTEGPKGLTNRPVYVQHKYFTSALFACNLDVQICPIFCLPLEAKPQRRCTVHITARRLNVIIQSEGERGSSSVALSLSLSKAKDPSQ